MAQAKTLSEKELKVALAVVAQGQQPARNRALLLMSFWAGKRLENLQHSGGGVVAPDGSIKDEIRLTADQTKGNKGRSVILGEKLCRELAIYVATPKRKDRERPFFYYLRQFTAFPQAFKMMSLAAAMLQLLSLNQGFSTGAIGQNYISPAKVVSSYRGL